MSHILSYLFSYWFIGLWLLLLKTLLRRQNIVVYRIDYQEKHNIFVSKTSFSKSIDLTYFGFFARIIEIHLHSDRHHHTTHPVRDAFVILTTETVITTNVGWKITNHIRIFEYRMNHSTVLNNNVWTSVIAYVQYKVWLWFGCRM